MRKALVLVAMSSLLGASACRPSTVNNPTPTPAPAPAMSPVAMTGTSGAAAIDHGTKEGPGTGGGHKDATGDKLGAVGHKHASGKGDGDGGGKKDGSGPKTAKPSATSAPTK